MPSPFPGMDPYLEDPAGWRDVHSRLIVHAAEALGSTLPKGYVARIDERLYLVEAGRDVVPDVTVSRMPVAAGAARGAGAVLADPPQLVTALTDEIGEPFIVITAVGDRRIVTTIEVLSPTNKTPNSEGRQMYLAKQKEMLASAASLLEIDLLRYGRPTAAVTTGVFIQTPPASYIACLHRPGSHLFECWPIALCERLPRVAVPLDADAPDVVLDLQQLVDNVYDRGGYADLLDYTGDPTPPIDPEDAAWADALLREKGLRA